MSPSSPTADRNLQAIRREFPILKRTVNGRAICYFDSAATSLKPQVVIEAVTEAMRDFGGNVGRSVHLLGEEVQARYDQCRLVVADFINADPEEIVFTTNATQAIQLVASNIPATRPVLTTRTEHHSNLLPWLKRDGLRFIDTTPGQQIDLEHLERLLREHPAALVTIAHVTNSFGTVNPIQEIVALAHQHGAEVLVDACQSISHFDVDVNALDCDYLCFSSHKMCGPAGIGVLYAKAERLAKMHPLGLGGGQVEDVQEDGYLLARIPNRFEAGTPPIESAMGMAAACDFLSNIGRNTLQSHGQQLAETARERLGAIPGVRVWGPETPDERGPIVAFSVEGIEAHGVARMLSNRFGICVRSGFHCAQLAHTHISAPPTVRASFHVYSTPAEVDALGRALGKILNLAT